jgi:uncharacterized RDD family membrane protein YckC
MASTDYRVLTPERVSLQYDIAGIGSRGAAAAIDTLLQTLLALVVGAVAFGGGVVLSMIVPRIDEVLLGSLVLALVALGLFCLLIGYFMLFEILWSGQTPGKRIVGVRVLRENGYPVRPVDSVIRNLVRLVDYLPLFYAIGLVAMLLNSRAKRLGDFAASTIVVREGARAALLMPPQALAEDAPRGPTLRAEDATLVRDFLLRRHGMNPQARIALAARLAEALSIRYGLAAEGDAESFLERLAG